MIGLAHKAGKLKAGTDSVIETVRGSKKPALVLIARNASAASKKKITDKCAYYNVKFTEIDRDMKELGHMIGNRSELMCTAILDEGFAKRISELTEQNSSDTISSAGGK